MCRPSHTSRSDCVHSITRLFVLCVCAAAVDPLDSGYDINVRSSTPGNNTDHPTLLNLRLGPHVSCSNRPISCSRPYVHFAPITVCSSIELRKHKLTVQTPTYPIKPRYTLDPRSRHTLYTRGSCQNTVPVTYGPSPSLPTHGSPNTRVSHGSLNIPATAYATAFASA